MPAPIPSVANLPCAAEHVAEYCSAESGHAWPRYDEDPLPNCLTPLDILAPALLSYPIKTVYLNQMFQRHPDGRPYNEYGELYDLMAAVVIDSEATDASFEALSSDALVDAERPGWGGVLRALTHVQGCRGLSSVAVTKILHRKRPDLVPINDSLVRQFYNVERGGYQTLFETLHYDLAENTALLDKLRAGYTTADGREMSRLRALDIMVWMHVRTHSAG